MLARDWVKLMGALRNSGSATEKDTVEASLKAGDDGKLFSYIDNDLSFQSNGILGTASRRCS